VGIGIDILSSTWIVATPVIGAHGIIDVVEGAAVVVGSIALAGRLLERLACTSTSDMTEEPKGWSRRPI
jgi:membrane-associated phospholipid phosphatase